MIEIISPRYERAMTILQKEGSINKVDTNLFTVQSQTGVGAYRIEYTNHGWKCNCPDYIKRGGQCKHIIATRYYLEIQKETPNGIQTEKVPLTYTQAWTAYNQAQTQ